MADINDIEFSGGLQYDLNPLDGDVQTATGGLRFEGFVRIISLESSVGESVYCL